jgi:tRNA threonylcarbamoyladenosine biosynthesis protein TsaE
VATRPRTSFSTYSEEETRALGERLGRVLRRGDVVLLHGELGAGKTRLAQGIAVGLDVRQSVTSPSYVLMNEYPGRTRLFHIDLYRLAEAGELEDLGVWDHAEDGCLVIEWPERAENLLPADGIEVFIDEGDAADARVVSVQSRGSRGDTILRTLEGAG